MTTLATTRSTDAQRLRPPIDPTLSNFIGLICAAMILLAFLFSPWYWESENLKFNGARLMSEIIVDGTFAPYVTLHIALIPLAALLTLAVTLWGLNSPERGTLASYATTVLGLVALFYFINFYFIDDTELIKLYVKDTDQMGDGFYWARAGAFGLILQVVFLATSIIPKGTLPRIPVGSWWKNLSVGVSGEHVTGMVGWQGLTVRLSKPRANGKPYIMSRKEMTAWMFLAGPLILYLIWIIGPTLYTFYLSLTNWDGVTNEAWIGLDNYRELFGADDFRVALGNNVRWFIIFITVPTTLGLFMAMIFNTEIRGGRWYKVSFYSPLVLSGPVIALVWSWVYHPKNGLINTILIDGGFTDDAPGWLADSDIAIYCIIAAAVWRQVGYVMVLYLAGLKNLDPTLMDAGLVDGANRWQLFRHVIFPLLAPITTIIVIISIIDSLRAFDLVQIMTRGNQKTEVLANLMYMEAFNNYRMGYGATIAVVLFSISVFFVGIYLWRTLKDELEY